MEYGQKIGNTTDYFVNPCPYTFKYYQKQIHDAIKQAFRENPGWSNPGTHAGVIVILAEINEWYHPFAYTDLVSSTFDRLWKQALRELQGMLVKRVPRRVKKSREPQKQDRIGEYYDSERLKAIIKKLNAEGISKRMIANLLEMHEDTIRNMINCRNRYKSSKVTEYVEKLVDFLDTLGVDTTGLIIDKSFCRGRSQTTDDRRQTTVETNSNEKLLQMLHGSRGTLIGRPCQGLFSKRVPLAAGGKTGGDDE